MSSLSLPELLDGAGLPDSRPCSRGSIASMPMPQPSYNDLSPRYTAPMRTGHPYSKLTSLQRGYYKSSRRYSPRNYDVRARYSASFRRKSACENRLTANSPFLPKSDPEHCLKCMLKVSHRKCESHKYIRVGGGYRHSYWYLKCLMEELERQRQQELIIRQRLAAISEKGKSKKLHAIKTYVRTKSGRLVEKIIYLDEEDYEQFKSGGANQKDILSKYMSKDEVSGLQSWDQDEVKAVKMMVRTKSGKLIEKIVYVSKDEYEALQSGTVDAKQLLAKYAKAEDGETVEGWGEAEMKTIKTYVRTKSGRLIEKTIMISKEDYDAMVRDGKDPAEILAKYNALGEGETLDSWKGVPEPMKAIKTKVRTKSGRIIEKTVYISQDDYDAMMKEGGDPNAILAKYLGMKEGETLETWEKTEVNAMKVIKTLVRTKSGRLIEKTVLLTEDEYREFQESGGNPDFLKKFLGLKEGESIDKWEKASTVYEGSDDEEMMQAKEGQRIVGKDGTVYEVVVDPLTGKKYKKKVGLPESDVDSGVASIGRKKKGGRGKRGGGGDGDDDEEDETPKERSRRKVGKRDARSDSEYSYKSEVSVGGTRRVKRRRKKADGTYSASESYHSSQDEAGQVRRRRRRRERKHGSDSEHSYRSVVSAGGTRHVKRRRKKADGTYSNSESYHSSDSDKEGGGKYKKKKKKERRVHGSDSDYSYTSEVSTGGTKTRKRTKRIRDEHGKVIGHGKEEVYSSSSDSDSNYSSYAEVSDGKGGKIFVKKVKPSKAKRAEQKKAAQLAKERARKGSRPVFSDASTESDDVDLTNMTEEEKKQYFAEKTKRKEEREKRRREKYGDSYDDMVALHEQKKKDKKEQLADEEEKRNAKSMVTYGKGKGRDTGPIEKTDGREPGMGHDEWGGKKKKGRGPGGDGNEADDESEEEDPVTGKRRKKKRGSALGSEASEYEYTYDKEGKVIGKKRVKGKRGDDDELSEYEYEYDKDGNVIGEKKVKGKGARIDSGSSTGDYFEKGADGTIRLKAGKKKIDLSKLTDEDLRNLGIDPTLSKAEIAKLLKQKFGDDIKITTGHQKVGTKGIDEYGSDVGTDELADDSDLDVDTLKGQRRVKIKMKRGGQALMDHMKLVMDMSKLQDDYAKDLDERGDIDFLAHYRLVDTAKLEGYARAFVCEDDDFDTVIDSKETRIAMDGVPGMQAMTSKQMEYVLKVLKIDDASQVTFKMFAVISALCERVNNMDPLSKHLLEICDLLDIERKMGLYRLMFYQNITSDRDSNFITAESLKIELIAGGLNWTQQQYIMERLQPTSYFEISFLDYLCYIPLFLSMHDNICLDPLDMSDRKYSRGLRPPSGEAIQRDMNPVGFPMKKESSYMLRKQSQDLLEGKIDPNSLKKEKLDLLNKYSKLPNILERPLSREETPKMVWNF